MSATSPAMPPGEGNVVSTQFCETGTQCRLGVCAEACQGKCPRELQ